jgi:hypothetical protein
MPPVTTKGTVKDTAKVMTKGTKPLVMDKGIQDKGIQDNFILNIKARTHKEDMAIAKGIHKISLIPAAIFKVNLMGAAAAILKGSLMGLAVLTAKGQI